ncbi:winged helix-turn-helix domain-containing protein [Marinivivus vitaminiproducens]|uniref:winged helix-turn-helix domain-containing protein n=1 Tax=Marinivivus vitaminiproducens TaxID=3035935 RepID=UPI0027A335D1|nr:LysR family transcriptional regulator [Geminicoccaceae bacterium SCSIO 64248]
MPASATRPGLSPGVTGTPRPARRGGDGASLTIRVDLGGQGALGPGKVALLEQIRAYGSISAAGREMGMSYRRAWLLVDSLNQSFAEPLVTTQHGGPGGGGAGLTPLGEEVVRLYRRIESEAHDAIKPHLQALGERLADPSP